MKLRDFYPDPTFLGLAEDFENMADSSNAFMPLEWVNECRAHAERCRKEAKMFLC
jgi:hypothetical protein